MFFYGKILDIYLFYRRIKKKIPKSIRKARKINSHLFKK